MRNFFGKLSAVFVFPSIVFTMAIFPWRCDVGRDGGVFRSDDFGNSWQQKVKVSEEQTIASKDILSLAIDPVNPSILYLGTQGAGLYRSTNEAEIWEPVLDKNNILDKRADVYDIEINSKNPNLIYLAVFQTGLGRVLRSQDNAQTWQEVYVVAKEKSMVTSIEIDKISDNYVYIGTAEGGIIKSMDWGASWQALKWFNDEVSNIKVDPKNNQIIYLATLSEGVYKSIDRGQTWQSLSDKISGEAENSFKTFKKEGKIKELIIDPRDSNILYVSSEKGLLKSFDGGQNWHKVNILMPTESSAIMTVVQDQKNPETIYYGAGAIVYRTTNGGQTWTIHQISSSREIRIIEIDPMDSNIIYVGIHE